jgi:hypothetical protein
MVDRTCGLDEHGKSSYEGRRLLDVSVNDLSRLEHALFDAGDIEIG